MGQKGKVILEIDVNEVIQETWGQSKDEMNHCKRVN